MARKRSSRRPRRLLAAARILLLVFIVAAAALAGYQFGQPRALREPLAQSTATPRPAPTAVPSATAAPSSDAAFETQAQGVVDAVLRSVPEPGAARLEREERRRLDARAWKWVSYRVSLQSSDKVKEATGALVKAVEEAGGVLLVSRPEGRGQLIEFGLEVGSKVYPIVRVMFGSGDGSQAPDAPADNRPRIAIIFDDAGQNLAELQRIEAIGRPMTVSILPGLPQSTALAQAAPRAGVEVMLHLPMQPEDASRDNLMGGGAVLSSMSDAEIAAAVAAGLSAVPGAGGVNNHMGSRGTRDERVVRAVLGVVRARGLYFIDSMTSAQSLAHKTALSMGVPSAARSIFLDNDTEPAMIREQMRALIRAAKRRGTAIAIGHANRPNTAEVVREMVAEIEAAGVRIVPVKSLAAAPKP
ncbi:MAG: divergent polysaccharide deacetylase family protein [Armatimonadetes bacterium]|nr:divergent polysaccharide deacetylase family protein [Armatimonadota bacterium]